MSTLPDSDNVLAAVSRLDQFSGASIVVQPVGMRGSTAELFRVDTDLQHPSSFVVKIPAMKNDSGVGYDRESHFYHSIAHQIEIRTPACFGVGIPGLSSHALLLEDLTGQHSGSIFAGSEELVALALMEIAKLHAAQDLEVDGLPVFCKYEADSEVGYRRNRYLEHFEQDCPDRYVRWLGSRTHFSDLSWSDPSLVHGDLHMGQVIFSESDTVLLDWQTVLLGPRELDVARLISSSLPTNSRRKHEKELVAVYADTFSDLSQRRVTIEETWEAYRRGVLWNVLLDLRVGSVVSREVVQAMVESSGEADYQEFIARTAWSCMDLGWC